MPFRRRIRRIGGIALHNKITDADPCVGGRPFLVGYFKFGFVGGFFHVVGEGLAPPEMCKN